ncbi:head completion/stabilization protein [Yersinia pseudotuberculosis]|uniref:Head completion protein n=1 Tax=Yersinia pseudotuberculosis serotype O:3 (strain YPIII) TaxID=502800 RepID=A0A0H3B0A9_YERPY|nr:head completion/stabilization protein [Yersinia pseudotuberculosis]AJJ58965.1 phage head completion family protein [Yersinia pseudotuberculosis YPIII]AJJ66554.1 phage head completion family protein [Yersinia pseudotuberculosis PB1/+]AYW86998.1 head completion/stabilization protein [Yersinia pseudotuberculosis]AYX01602.1 head completion/stabilization protein [Yersinia pseudotuberculosis]AZA29356.1 head completion/stabilization protein [Yersinia pseudotuberculosis]
MFRPGDNGFQEATLTNDGFWPDLALSEFQRQRSIPPTIHETTVTQALLAAVAEINGSLADFVRTQKNKGYTAAAEVPGPVMEGENALTAQYKKAVYARAKADLLGEFASVSRREDNTNQDAPQTKAGLLSEAAFALRCIKGLKRVGVRLV